MRSTHAERQRFRRAVTLLLLTLLAPGSAQYIAGNRAVGRFALRVAGGVVAVVVLGVLVGLVSAGTMVSLLTNQAVLATIQVGLVLLALGWLGLFVDAWRLGRPLGMRQKQRLTSTLVTVGLSALAVTLVLTSSHYVAVARESLNRIFAGTKVEDPHAGRYNILLLGADAGPNRVGLRPDSITLLSVDARTGATAMFSFPRNLQRVRFPEGTVMRKQFPDGFGCGDECLLNAVYTWANDHKDLFPGVADPGIQATKDAIRGITGLPVTYYVLVDMAGFQQLVDAMGGITIDVGRRVRITGPEGQLRGVIEPGRQRLDGYHALWYARSRVDTNDYDRMARQRCVMAAMLHQLDPATVLVKFREIARAGEQLISTDIPPGELDTLASLALKARHGTVTSVQFVPPLIKTARPDFDLIKEKVQEALAVSASPSPSAGEVEDDTDQTGTSAAGGDPGASSSSAGSDGGTSGGADAGSGEAGGADEEDEPPAVTELDQACAAG